jgi:hypothetical protein
MPPLYEAEPCLARSATWIDLMLPVWPKTKLIVHRAPLDTRIDAEASEP